MIEWFIEMMQTNSVAQGVFAGLIASAPLAVAAWFFRDLPRAIWNFVKNFYKKEVEFISDLDDYEPLSTHIDKYIIWSRNRTYSERQEKVTIGYGTHYGVYNKVPFIMSRKLEKQNSMYEFKETTSICFFERKHKSIETYVKESLQNRSSSPKIYSSCRGGWDCSGPLAPRNWESIFCDKKEIALTHIQKFKQSEQEYLDKGMPWHTGILLYGEPGTGKTTIIKGIANKLGLHIKALDPTQMGGATYAQAVEGVWDDSILVIEDIDTNGSNVNREDKNSSAPLSSLLNSLDGIYTPHGLITIATTNNLEKLDPALIRPGRFDLVIEIGKMTEKEAMKMAEAFDYELKDYTPMTGAELRRRILSVEPN